MAKKIILGLVFTTFVVSGAFTQSHGLISAGIGGDFGFVFTNMNTNIPQPYKGQLEDQLANVNMNRAGITAFIDFTYLELDIGLKFYNFTYKQSGADIKETDNHFNFGLLAKYPFVINERLTFFP